jgi:hypothetical protein
MNLLRVFVTSLLFILLYGQGFAQTPPTTTLTETGNWNGVYIKARLTNKIGYYGEHHYRLRNSADDLYDFVGRRRQVYNRAGINIFFHKYFEFVIGPTLVFNYSPTPQNENHETYNLEPRIWHQWLFITPEMGRLKLYHQFRFEHRWKKNGFTVDDPFDYTNRYRYKVFAYIPINKPRIEEKTLFISPSAEIFMQTGGSILYSPFEDFRTYNGIGYVLNQNITFFAGHMWTIGQSASSFNYRTTHILRFNVMIGIDGRRIDKKLPVINLGY